MSQKMKVVWLCHFSNSFVHDRLVLGDNWLNMVLRRVFNKPLNTQMSEMAIWITNGIAEMENKGEIELHVISPYPHLKYVVQEFTENGVHYHFFRDRKNDRIYSIFNRFFPVSKYEHKRNRHIIKKLINSIRPDVVHLFGAENPYYAVGILCDYNHVITIAQLQTLVNDPNFKNNYPIDAKEYDYRAGIEAAIIKNVDYIGTTVTKYRQIIIDKINPKAVFLNTSLLLQEPIVTETCEKQFDFVYFAANVNKAVDLAIEAFALVHKKKPEITLDIIGGYESSFKQSLDILIAKKGITAAVTFEGKLPTHREVLNQIRKARFALLPLKVDLTSGTIREAMSNGIPVLTTDTGELGTQKLNKKRQNVLISPIGNHQALADNMLLILSNKDMAETLRNNAYQTRLEMRSNAMSAKKYMDAYKACLDNHWSNIPLPKEVTDI